MLKRQSFSIVTLNGRNHYGVEVIEHCLLSAALSIVWPNGTILAYGVLKLNRTVKSIFLIVATFDPECPV